MGNKRKKNRSVEMEKLTLQFKNIKIEISSKHFTPFCILLSCLFAGLFGPSKNTSLSSNLPYDKFNDVNTFKFRKYPNSDFLVFIKFHLKSNLSYEYKNRADIYISQYQYNIQIQNYNYQIDDVLRTKKPAFNFTNEILIFHNEISNSDLVSFHIHLPKKTIYDYMECTAVFTNDQYVNIHVYLISIIQLIFIYFIAKNYKQIRMRKSSYTNTILVTLFLSFFGTNYLIAIFFSSTFYFIYFTFQSITYDIYESLIWLLISSKPHNFNLGILFNKTKAFIIVSKFIAMTIKYMFTISSTFGWHSVFPPYKEMYVDVAQRIIEVLLIFDFLISYNKNSKTTRKMLTSDIFILIFILIRLFLVFFANYDYFSGINSCLKSMLLIGANASVVLSLLMDHV